MFRITRDRRLCGPWLLVAAVAGGIAVSPAPAADAPTAGQSLHELREQVFQQWRRRRERFQSVRCVLEGTALVPKGTFEGDPQLSRDAIGPVPAEDYEHPWRLDVLIDFAGNRFRVEEKTQIFNITRAQFHPVHDVTCFNGADLRRELPGVRDNQGTYYSRTQPEFVYHENDYPVLTLQVQPVLFACGVVLAGTQIKNIGKLGDGPSANLAIRGRAVHEGAECLVLRSAPRDKTSRLAHEYWVDPAKDGLIVRAMAFESTLIATVTMRYALEKGDWRLVGFVLSQPDLMHGGRLRQIITAEVSSLEENPAVENVQFELTPRVGAVVSNNRERRGYVVGEGGVELPISSLLRPRSNAATYWSLAIVLTAAAAAIFVLFYRRRRGFASPPFST